MSVLDIVRASDFSDCQIPTLELSCSAWDKKLYLCAGIVNELFGLETGEQVLFLATGLDASLPSRNNEAGQQLTVAIDNVTTEATVLIDQARDAQAVIKLVFRIYLESDPSEPAERPIAMSVLSSTIEGPSIQFVAGYFDLVNTAWPRVRYTTKFSPGIKYIT